MGKGTPKKLLSDYIEVRAHGMYSSVAEELGLTIQQVESVYQWYLSKTLTEIKEKPTVKVKFSGLGTLVFDMRRSCRFLYRKLRFYATIMENPVNWPENKVPKEHFLEIYNRYSELLERVEVLFARAKGKNYYKEKELDYSERFLSGVKKAQTDFYESIQRIFKDGNGRPEEPR